MRLGKILGSNPESTRPTRDTRPSAKCQSKNNPSLEYNPTMPESPPNGTQEVLLVGFVGGPRKVILRYPTDAEAEECSAAMGAGESLAEWCEGRGIPAGGMQQALRAIAGHPERMAAWRASMADHSVRKVASLANTAEANGEIKAAIDAHRWLAERMAPEEYGGKPLVNVGVNVDSRRVDLSGMTVEQLEALAAIDGGDMQEKA